MTRAASSAPGATVRLEVRVGPGQPVVYEVGDGGFLVGSVPGCDLRLPGSALPAVVCLISRLPTGATLRKLASVFPLQVNQQPATSLYLKDGDRLEMGPAQVVVRIENGSALRPEKDVAPREDLSAERERLAQERRGIEEARKELVRLREEIDVSRAAHRPKPVLVPHPTEEIRAAQEQLQRERELVEEQHRLFMSRQQEVSRELRERLAELERREKSLSAQQADLEKGQGQYQADLVRLDRRQGVLETREKQLADRAVEIDRRFEQMQRDSRDLEEQATQLDEQHRKLSEDREAFESRKAETSASLSDIAQRSGALEGQQAMLATLRTRLERMREELRRQEKLLADQAIQQEEREQQTRESQQEAERLREELASERMLFEEERRRYEERRETMDQAVAQLRQAQEKLVQEQRDLEVRQQSLGQTDGEQREQAALLLVRGEQLAQLSARMQSEQESLREREAALSRREASLAALQEQVRLRLEEMEKGHQELDRRDKELQEKEAGYAGKLAEAEAEHQRIREELDRRRQELDEQGLALESRGGELARQAEELLRRRELHGEVEQVLTDQRVGLHADWTALEVERQSLLEQDRQTREEFARTREEIDQLHQLLPALELRVAAAQERLGQGREQLREHLAEIHAYARQSRADLDAARQLVQAEGEKVRQQAMELEARRDEHRLSVAAFRQQLIDWQGRVQEMRQSLQVGTSQLELRQQQVEARAREVADTSARLAQEAQHLHRERQAVMEKRGEMDRHLVDMREWYRKKLRDLARVDLPPDAEPGEGDVVPLPIPAAQQPTEEIGERSPARAVLTLQDEIEPADRQLGDLLASLGLVDDDTLQALWAEARRQRRSLRQLLLAGGYLTLYQMALIETGNLDGLMLGPVRVIDRLPSGPREAVYRVFDPRHNIEAILRHLAESEMEDAVRPDEFQQRFAAAAAVEQTNVARVFEALSIGGRPAVLVEWVGGLASTEWPALASAPGVWYRLVCQAALALRAVHQAGLVHGRLDGNSFVLTGQGVLKLVGLGEPDWLSAGSPDDAVDTPEEELRVFGQLIASWANIPATSRGGKLKPLPEELLAILVKLQSRDQASRYASIQQLVDDLEQVGRKVGGIPTAWDRLLRHVRGQSTGADLRESA